MICEDYPREPPAEKRRYHNGLANGGSMRRTLTQPELTLASQYHGGQSWIVVTLDSREAADRALSASPHNVSGHWTFAEPWRGIGPPQDKPIPGNEDPGRAKSTTMGGGAVSRRQENRSQSATLPRDFMSNGEERLALVPDDYAETSTVTSATATAFEETSNEIRQRQHNRSGSPHDEDLLAVTPAPTKTHFTHFPNTPRTMIKPAAEALLPQPSWLEGVLKSLAVSGWIPGDMIGSRVPRKEDGVFDSDAASVYWKFWYWIDCMIGTDFCGLKED